MNPLPHIDGWQFSPMTEDDAVPWARYVCDPEVMRLTSSTARSVDDLLPLLQRMNTGQPDAPMRFVARRPYDDDPVLEGQWLGTVGFHTVSWANRSAEISYDVHPELWGQGIATALCRAATDWGLQACGWHRIQATTLPEHAASQVVLQRCGYSLEGRLRKFRMVRGEPRDYLLFARVA